MGGSRSNSLSGDLDQISLGEGAVRLAVMTTTQMELDIPQLRREWVQECESLFMNQLDELPPLREINHKIPLIDESKVYHHRQPKCPDVFKPALMAKIERYTKAGWWVPITASRATPMLCIPKSAKNPNELRTVFDLREQNANTRKDLTPMPDQDAIRHAVAKARFRSKCDISNAYELIRVEPEDVWKTAFATISGTFASNVMQQGDCNAPSTFQRFITHLLRDFVGKFVYAYLDDIFIFSDTVEEHQEHIRLVVDRLRESRMVLNPKKCDFFSEKMDCLGHIIDDQGIHADTSKMEQIQNWRAPRSYHDVQRFLGLVQYIQHFMPNVSIFTAPLSAITKNGHDFMWRPLHEKCFAEIKALATKAPILKPINPEIEDPIWVVCNASASGVGAFYGQGKTWENCRPAGFMSRKFKEAQQNYRVFEMETLAILEALTKWEDKLIGRKFTVITDHQSLEFFSRQKHLSGRQARWAEYLSRFDFEVTYVKGQYNIVADCLSRYYSSDLPGETHAEHQYVSVDVRLDPDGDDLPYGLKPEMRTLRIPETPESVPRPTSPHKEIPEPITLEESQPENGPSLAQVMSTTEGFLDDVRAGYVGDALFSKIRENPDQFNRFRWNDGLLYMDRADTLPVLCIPQTMHKSRKLTEMIIDQAHQTIGHAGSERTSRYIHKFYWWSTMSGDIAKFCATCGTCQAIKPITQQPAGLLHPLPIPSRPWESIGMDFIGPLPPSPEGYNFIWVVIDRLTSMIHLVALKTSATATEVAERYLKDIVRLHGVASSIVSDRDPRFTSTFWREAHRLLGTKLMMSTSFHPQTDGVTERVNRVVNQVLRAVIQPDQSDWYEKLPMVEFAINSSENKSTGYAPFELNYGYIPTLRGLLDRVPVSFKPGVRHYAEKVQSYLMAAHDAIIAARINQMHHANKRRRKEPDYRIGDRVWLSTDYLAMPKGRARKLMPKFIGPFMITKMDRRTSNYQLELPDEMKSRHIRNRFHADRLQPYLENDEALFPGREAKYYYDYGVPEDEEWYIDAIIGHAWQGRRIRFNVQWSLGDTTWEPYEHCKDLAALDEYLALHHVTDWKKLARNTGEGRAGRE